MNTLATRRVACWIVCAGTVSILGWMIAPASAQPRMPLAPPGPAVSPDPLPPPRVADQPQDKPPIGPAGPCEGRAAPLFGPDGIFAPGTEVMLIDLPTALRIANSANPTIAFARARIQEAYVRVQQAQLLWIPDLQMGTAYFRHDGNIQNSTGVVFDTNKSNVTLFGGPTLQVATADAIFAPLIARRQAAAQAANTQAVTNNLQLDVAKGYFNLLQAYGMLAINADILARDAEVLRRTDVADRTGLAKTGADLPRIQSEYQLRLQERLAIRGQIRVASSSLARLLLLQPNIGLLPADPTLAPITLISEDSPIDQLIGQAVVNRPELAEARALIAASQVQLRQARLNPLMPQLQFSYYGGYFGGGLDSSIANFQARGDGTAQAVWVFKNLGFGNLADTRLRRVQLTEAGVHAVQVRAQVADEVNQAVQIAQICREALPAGADAVRQALETFRRLDFIAFGMTGRKKELESLEPLIAIQMLAQARNQYLANVMDYNRAQFQLFTAVGVPPIQAPANPPAVPLPLSPYPAPYVPPMSQP